MYNPDKHFKIHVRLLHVLKKVIYLQYAFHWKIFLKEK